MVAGGEDHDQLRGRAGRVSVAGILDEAHNSFVPQLPARPDALQHARHHLDIGSAFWVLQIIEPTHKRKLIMTLNPSPGWPSTDPPPPKKESFGPFIVVV